MNKLTTKLLGLSAVLLLFMGITASTASAQIYAEEDGTGAAPCLQTDPCELDVAQEYANTVPGSTIYVRVPNTGGTSTHEVNLTGTAAITEDVIYDSYLETGGSTTLGVDAIIAVEGNIVINGDDVLTIAENVELQLVGQPATLELNDGAVINGDGFIAFTATGGNHTIFLGSPLIDCGTPPTPPNTAWIRNMRVDKPNGDVDVIDECATDTDGESDLYITNRLDVDAGFLNLHDNNLHITSLSEASGGVDPGVEIGGGAVIDGDGSFFIMVEEPAAGPIGFANTSDDCFEITGDGNLNMALDKRTNAGVCIELDEIGSGGKSHNRAGTLYITDAIQFNGTFINESLTGEVVTSGARTEFWALKTITTNLEVDGPGDEVIDPFDDWIDVGEAGEECETGGGATGNESGVYFFDTVTVEGDLILNDTDDTTTSPCVEGVWFMGDDDPDDSAAAKTGKTADHQAFSTIEGDFNVAAGGDPSGVYLDDPGCDDCFVHNVAFQGDFIFGSPSPIFTLVNPADAYPVGDLCGPYNNEADGNKVLFTGGADQLLKYPDDLVIPSVQIKKNSTGQDVEIDNDPPDTGGTFIVDTSLEILRGTFITNGLLDAEGTATVVINRDEDGSGVLQAGAAERAYISDDSDDTPLKVKYTGNIRHFSGDEIPGDRDGSVEGNRIYLPFLEIFSSADDAVITLGKDFTIGPESQVGGKLIITQGILDVGSSIIRLSNTLRIEIGDGDIAEPNQIGARGAFEFPTQWIPDPTSDDGFNRAFEVGADGIDLLYFGTTDRTVGLEWPPSETEVDTRYEDADVIRDVTIHAPCVDDDDVGVDDNVISLREEDDEFRINGDLVIGGYPFIDSGDRFDDNAGTEVGALDIVGNVLELNATHNAKKGFNDTVLEVHNDADLCDSTDTLGVNPPGCDQPDAANARMGELVAAASAAMAEYRRTLSKEAAAEMQVHFAALQAAKQELAKTAEHAGLLRFIGGDRTDVWVGTSSGRLRFDFPAIEVDKNGVDSGDDSRVTFDANGVLSTSTGDVPANRPDILGTSHFTLINAEIGSDNCPDSGCGDAGGVELYDGLDVLDVRGQYEQYAGEFLMAGVSSIGPAPTKSYVQRVQVGFELEPGNMIIEDGEFFAGNPGGAGAGGDVEVFGDFCLGCTPPATNGAASKLAADPSSGVFSLAINGTHTVVGDFTVGPDEDPSDDPLDVDARNRYFLGGECAILPDKGGLFANGNYHFEGTGDRFDDLSWLQQQQGLHGNVFFTGAGEQTMWHRQDEDAFFCDVVMASRSDDNTGILLLSNGWQNDEGTLTLEHGLIDTDEGEWDWIIQNTGFETDLAGRNNSARGTGVVDLGSRDSYVNGEVDRRVETGNASGGVITGGYLFPVGIEGEERDDGPVGTRNVDFFRPLILQFPDDLGRHSLARVNYVGGGDVDDGRGLSADDCEWPDANLIVDAVGGGTLELDVVSNQFWQLEFDRIPSFDPNVRVEADDLPNIFDIKSLRLIQWDCDCQNPKLAGLYDLTGGDPVDDASAVLNDFINEVPNITQEGVNVDACQIIGIASNFLINPINIPPLPSGLARVQLIHNVPDAPFPVDVYVDDNRVWNDATFQTATGFLPVAGGTHTVDLVAGSDADNSSPIFSQELTVHNEINYVVVAHGLVNPGVGEPPLKLVVEDGVRLASTDEERIDFFVIHGAPRLGQVDIRELDPVTNNTVVGLLANNVSFDDVGAYLSLDTGVGHNIEITTADANSQIDVFRFELQARSGAAAVFNLSGNANKAVFGDTTPLTIMGVEASGDVFFPDLITADEPDLAAELPTTFELHGNYPNPFNPSTTIAFDLPQTAEVTVEVIDMLGRSVMLLPAQQMEAGAARTVEVSASNLASGAYLYRLVAKTATETMVKTGRMMLVK